MCNSGNRKLKLRSDQVLGDRARLSSLHGLAKYFREEPLSRLAGLKNNLQALEVQIASNAAIDQESLRVIQKADTLGL